MKNSIKFWAGIIFVAFALILWFFRTYFGAETYFIAYLQSFLLIFVVGMSMLVIARTRRMWVLLIAVILSIILDPYILSEIFNLDVVKSKHVYISMALSMLGVYIASIVAVIFAELKRFNLIRYFFASIFALIAITMAYWPYHRWN